MAAASRSARCLAVAPLLLVCAVYGWAQPEIVGPRPAFAPAAGPDAEYLEISENYTLRDDGSVVRVHRSRLVVNSYLAINRLYGESSVVWDPTTETCEVLANRTVLPGGEIVEAPANAVVDDLPREAHRNPLWSHLRRRVMVHTALEPGAVIESSFRVTRRDAPWLELEQQLRLVEPVRSLEVVVDVPVGEKVSWQLARGGAGRPSEEMAAGRRVVRFRWQNLAAWPDEPGAPPRNDTVPVLWLSTCSRGGLEAELSRRLGSAGELPASARALVERAVAGKVGWEERLHGALSATRDAFQVSVGLSLSMTGFTPKPLGDVWQSGRASPLELSLFAARALATLGIEASPVLLGVPERDANSVPGFVGFDRALLAVIDGEGSRRLVDPLRPSEGGALEEVFAGRSQLGLTGSISGAARGQEAEGSVRTLSLTLRVAADSAISGGLAFSGKGDAVPHAALVENASSVAANLASAVPEGRASEVRVTALTRRAAELSADVAGKLDGPDQRGLVHLVIGGVPEGSDETLPPLPVSGRVAPIALPGPGEEVVELELALPEGWAAVALPESIKVRNGAGGVEIASEQRPDRSVKVVRRLSITARMQPPTASAQVRELLVAWRSPATRELLLRPAPDPTGTGRD